jgi:hypothetical protein
MGKTKGDRALDKLEALARRSRSFVVTRATALAVVDEARRLQGLVSVAAEHLEYLAQELKGKTHVGHRDANEADFTLEDEV